VIRALVRSSVQRPVTVLMAFLALCVLGTIALVRIPLQAMPDGFVLPNLWVGVDYGNATPQETEIQVTRPIEDQLSTLVGLSSMESTSDAGGSWFDLEFSRDVDMDDAYNDVVDRMERALADLPAEVTRYWIWRWNPADQPIVWAGAALPDGLEDPYWTLTQVIQKRIERVPGVGKVEAWGASPQRVAIDLKLDELVKDRVSIYGLMGMLAQDNFQLASGKLLDRGQVRYVRSLARWGGVEQLRALPVQPGVRLGHVADVAMRPFEVREIDHINGKPGSALAIYKESGANTVAVSDAVESAFRELEQDGRLMGAHFFTFFSQGDLIRRGLDSVRFSALTGGIFAVVILLVFLRELKVTVLIAACIPFSTLLTVTVLYFTGGSLNIISLMGLMLSVGMVVDNAIVVVESIYLHRQQGASPFRAAVEGTSEVGLAITMATLCHVVVFLPVILMTGDAELSFFMGALGLPVVFALLASLLVSLVFTPLTTTLLSTTSLREEAAWSRRLTGLYGRALAAVLRRRSDAGFGVFALLMLTLVIPVQGVRCESEAEGNLSDFTLRYTMPSSMSQDDKLAVVNTVEKFVDDNRDRWGVEVHRSRVDGGSTRGRTWVTLERDPPEGALDREEVLADAQDHLPQIPGVEISVGRSEDQGDNSSLGIALRGEDTETLRELGEEVRRRLVAIPGVLAVHADVESGGEQEVRLDVDRDASARSGLDSRRIGQTVAFALRGSTLSPLVTSDREIEVKAAFQDAEHTELNELLDLPVGTTSGGVVPLRAVVHPQVAPGLGGIHREARQTAWPMTVELDPKAGSDAVRAAVGAVIGSMALPQGYSWDWGFRDRDRESDNQALLLAMTLSIVFVFVIMGVLFESFLLPMAILTTIPMAICGVYWTLHLTGTPLDVMGGIGLVVLVGVVVNNGIVLIDHVAQRRAAGLDRTEALIEAGQRRLRPILMTALTTIVGILPMAFGDDNLIGIPYAPLGRVVAGGMATGTLLTLFFLPYLYAVLDDMRASGRRWFAWVAGNDGTTARSQG